MARTLRAAQIDLIILDILMPGEDGLSLCRRLRRERHHPDYHADSAGERSRPRRRPRDGGRLTIWLSRSASANCWPASALFFGVRPCPRTVRHPVLDRSSSSRAGASTRPAANCAPLRVLWSTCAAAEFELLLAFVERPRHVLTRDQLLELARGRSAAAVDRSIDVHISRLRHRLEVDPGEPELIKTVRGEGYVFAAPVKVNGAAW